MSAKSARRRSRTENARPEDSDSPVLSSALWLLLVLLVISWILYFSGILSPGTTDPNAIDPRIVPPGAPR